MSHADPNAAWRSNTWMGMITEDPSLLFYKNTAKSPPFRGSKWPYGEVNSPVGRSSGSTESRANRNVENNKTFL
eukprot:8957542-Pyramimonas_sp.AAC.1